MRRLIVAVVATGALGALSANAQQLSAQAISPDEKVSNQQNWVFGTNECDFDPVNGTITRIVGFLNAGAIAWIQGFDADETCGCIGGIDIQMYRITANPTEQWEGREVTVYLWDDPTNDFDPSDAEVKASATMIVPVGRGPMQVMFAQAQTVSDRFWAAGSIFSNGIVLPGGAPTDEYPAAFNNIIINTNDWSWLAYNDGPVIDPDLSVQPIQTWDNPFRVFPIPVDPSLCDGCAFAPADMNCDGVVDALDIEPFICLLFDPNCVPC